MESDQLRRSIRLYFDVSVILKGLISFVEVVAGILALFVPVSVVTNYLLSIAGGELVEQPNDFFAQLLSHSAQQLAVTSGTFIALYLLSRGLIKLLLVVALLKNQLWAYPTSLVVIGAFVCYQIYQFAVGHSLFIVLLTIFDFIVMYFIWREYQILRELRDKRLQLK
jgi:uncharacterized membrane protein